MDWRQYDPVLGRFNVIDPLAEKMLDQTPYHFAFNNPLYFKDPTGLYPEDQDQCCPDDINLGELEEVFLGTFDRGGSRADQDPERHWTTEIQEYDYAFTERDWEIEFEMSPDDYTPEMEREYMRYWGNSVKRYRLKAFFNRLKYINDIGALEHTLTYLKAATAGRILSFSGSSGVLSNIGKDSGLQLLITGDVDLISSGSSAFTGRYKHLARFVGANFDYSMRKNSFNRTFDDSKPFNHMLSDWGASYIPGLSKNMASPGNYLGHNGLRFTGNAFGVLGSDLVKKQL